MALLVRIAAGVVTAILLVGAPSAIAAQGVTTSGIHGRVTAAHRAVDARISVRHEKTGFTVEARAPIGRFLVQGLEPGGPYTVTVRALGFVPQRREALMLSLGELRATDFALDAVATPIDAITVAARRDPGHRAPADGGTGTTIPATLIATLPTLNRDLHDFVRLVPQVSGRIGLANPGISAGGMGFRFNEFLINGVSERTLSGGVSSAFAGARSVPIDAVQEYQVLHAPYDVRYGNFAGALVNAITKAGTNEFSGSLFALGRNQRLARRSASGIQPYERAQYGFSIGGPLVRDRMHFLVAPELQHLTSPAPGPWLGQQSDAELSLPVTAADLERFDAIMRAHGLVAGSAGPVQNRAPLRNLFSRVDVAIPVWNSRAVIWNNYSGSGEAVLSRAARDTFSLSSYQVTRNARSRTTAAQLHTAFPRAGGGHNELLVSARAEGLDAVGAVEQPLVRVVVTSVSGGRVTLNSGTHESAQGGSSRSAAVAVRDNLTLPLGSAHVLTVGADLERFQLRRGSTGGYGAWRFASLDNLELGIADRYELRLDAGRATAALTGEYYSAYVADRWQATADLALSGGVRADLLAFDGSAPYNRLVDSLFGRRTDRMPERRVELSPRLGFTWDLAGTQRLRGGAGIFAGRYPLAWVHSALVSHGASVLLRCTRTRPDAQPPAFDPDYSSPPTACLGSGAPAADTGDVNLVDPRLRMMRVARASLAYEGPLLAAVRFTGEGVVTRALSDLVMMNLNLAPPVASDAHGRVMYGTITEGGTATPKRVSPFAEVIDLRNTSAGHSAQLSLRLDHAGRSGSRALLAYTHTRARDAQTLLRVNTRGTAAWAVARATAGRHDDLTPGISGNDIAHRVVVARTWVTGVRWRTEWSGYYIGESGRPFTWTATGDLNADGSNANDPVYVPRSALDPLEILISGTSSASGEDNSPAAVAAREQEQRDALEQFIARTDCLRRQRGRILARNSCREPWSNTMLASVRQSIPLGRRALEAQLDVLNVLNLLHPRWGLQRQASPGLLEHVGQSPQAQPVFRFNRGAGGWINAPAESAFQLQLGARYRF